MRPPYKSPQDAVNGLIEAYRSLNVEQVIESKDFDADSRIFWENLGLPVSPKQMADSRLAFETNFRNEMKSGIPDYRSVTFRVVSEDQLQDNFVIVTLAGVRTDGRTCQLRIPVLQTANGWKVVLHSNYDHL